MRRNAAPFGGTGDLGGRAVSQPAVSTVLLVEYAPTSECGLECPGLFAEWAAVLTDRAPAPRYPGNDRPSILAGLHSRCAGDLPDGHPGAGGLGLYRQLPSSAGAPARAAC